MFFHYKFLAINYRGNVKTFCITFIDSFNIISIYVDIFKAEQILEYNVSLIWNLVPFGSIMFAFPKLSIKFAVPDKTNKNYR